MNKQFYFLSPVEVVKVTSQNLAEVAEWCGGSVQETESRRVPGRMDKYVLVPTPKDTNISWAFPGMFITKRLVITVKDELRETYAVFRRDYFEKNYFDTPKDAADKTWERQELAKKKPQAPKEVHVTVNVGQALLEAQQRVQELEQLAEDNGLVHTEEVHRDAKSGEYTSPEYAAANPDTTVAEEVRVIAKDAEIPTENIRAEDPPTVDVVVAGVEQEDDTELVGFKHDHNSFETCDSNGCTTDRYVDGVHVFNDKIVNTEVAPANA